jgi:hypothetical protein
LPRSCTIAQARDRRKAFTPYDFVRLGGLARLYLLPMHATTALLPLEARLAELMMSQLNPCDLGDGIEVIHDVETVEIELDCEVHDDDELGTHQFVRYSAPYERIEVQLDAHAYRRATIEEARKLVRAVSASDITVPYRR